jgi:hypothetical protein
MSTARTPTPWHDNRNGLIYGQPAKDQEGAPFVADVIAGSDRAAFGILTDRERANAAFIVRACNGHESLITVLKLALQALNSAPRFRVGGTDSYKIASQIETALKLAEVRS